MEKNTIAVIMAIISALIAAVRINNFGKKIGEKIPTGTMMAATITAALAGYVITLLLLSTIESPY